MSSDTSACLISEVGERDSRFDSGVTMREHVTNVVDLPSAAGMVGNQIQSAGAAWFGKAWVQRALIGLVRLAFLHVFPTMLFIVYMGQHGIFDYGFFREGPFALGVFYGTAELLLVLASLTMFGICVALPGWYRSRKVEWLIAAVIFVGVNALTLVAVVTAIAGSDVASLTDGLLFLSLSFLIAVHLSVTVHFQPRAALLSLLLVLSSAFLLTALRPQTMTGVLGWGLSVYNVGGNVGVRVEVDGQTGKAGKLVFLGPDRTYVRFDGESTTTILERGQHQRIVLLGKDTRPNK